MQFSAKSVAIAVLAMVRFSVRIRGGAHMLKIRFRQRRLVRRQCAMVRTAAGGKENKGDENRQQN